MKQLSPLFPSPDVFSTSLPEPVSVPSAVFAVTALKNPSVDRMSAAPGRSSIPPIATFNTAPSTSEAPFTQANPTDEDIDMVEPELSEHPMDKLLKESKLFNEALATMAVAHTKLKNVKSHTVDGEIPVSQLKEICTELRRMRDAEDSPMVKDTLTKCLQFADLAILKAAPARAS
jgi:hypothetical protein